MCQLEEELVEQQTGKQFIVLAVPCSMISTSVGCFILDGLAFCLVYLFLISRPQSDLPWSHTQFSLPFTSSPNLGVYHKAPDLSSFLIY